jgi:tetratricopeptide (TPR) repeat protein
MAEQEAIQSLKLADSYLKEVMEALDQGVEGNEDAGHELLNTIDLAMKQIDKAEETDPTAQLDDIGITRFRARAFGLHGTVEYRALGKRSAAISSLKKSIELADDIDIAHFTIGVIYADTGKKEDGLRHLRKSVDLAPDDMEYRKTLDRLEHVSSVGLKVGAFRGSWKVILVLCGLSLFGLVIFAMAIKDPGAPGGSGSAVVGIGWLVFWAAIVFVYWRVKSR